MNLYKANVTLTVTYSDAVYAESVEEAQEKMNKAAIEMAGDLDPMVAEVHVEVIAAERVDDES